MTSGEHAGHPSRRGEFWLSGNQEAPLAGREVALVDLLDRLLAGGVVVTGDIALSIAGVDLVHISLRALITSVKADRPAPR
jgi:hypothetical protein